MKGATVCTSREAQLTAKTKARRQCTATRHNNEGKGATVCTSREAQLTAKTKARRQCTATRHNNEGSHSVYIT